MTEIKEKISKRFSAQSFKKVLGGTILASNQVTNQLPFVFFLAFLGIALRTNRY